MSLASTNLSRAQEDFAAGCTRDVPRLTLMDRELHHIARVFAETVGSGHIDGAFDKVLWRLHDRRFPLRLLPPYEGACEAAAEAFAAFLRSSYREWA